MTSLGTTHWMVSEHFFPEFETKLFTFSSQGLGQARVATVEHGHLSLTLLFDLGEDFVPVWSASIGPRLESGHEVSLLLVVKNVKGKLKGHRLHVCGLQGAGHIHVHLQEPAHTAPILLLLYLQLGQQVHKPLEALLVPVDPEEVHLLEFEHARLHVIGPSVAAIWTGLFDLPVAMHYGLED